MPLKIGLTHTQMKLGRAYEHIKELDREVTLFLQNPYTVTFQDDPEHSLHIVRAQVNGMRPSLGMLVGEFAYQTRSSLDNLAWQLALLTTDFPNRDTSFPILETKPGPRSDRFIAATWDLPCAATDIIKSLQPYQRGNAFKTHPLWQLNKLCNIDKHRAVAISSTEVTMRVDGVSSARRRNSYGVVEIAVPIAEKEHMKFNINNPKIVFGDPIEAVDAASEFELTLADLSAIYNFVGGDAVPRFKQFFF